MIEPKTSETEEATAQEQTKQASGELAAKQEAAEADAPLDQKDLEGVAGGGIAPFG